MGKLNLTYWSDSLPLGPASLMEADYQQSAQHRHEEPYADGHAARGGGRHDILVTKET